MTQPFDSFQEDDDYGSESPSFGSEPVFDDDFDMDSLRQQSARSGSTFDDMESDSDMDGLYMEDDADSGRSRFSLSNFSRRQQLVIALLVLLDILAIGFGILVVMGRVSF
jgi:hypothetical protein